MTDDPAKVVFFTDATSHLSLPVLRSLHESQYLDVVKVVLYDNVAASRARFLSVIRAHGIKKTISKVTQLLIAKMRSKFSANDNTEMHFARDYAVRNGIETVTVKNVNSADFVQGMRELGVDLIVVCSFTQIIKPNLLEVPRVAAINVHPSLLPKYRGPEPVFWALYHNEAESGVSYHKIEPGIDTGDIIHQVRLPIPTNTNVDDLTQQLFGLAGRHAEEAIVGFQQGDKKPVSQDESDASYFSFPNAEQRKELAGRLRQS